MVAAAGDIIRFTTDGSTPGISSGAVFSEPILLGSGKTTLRAITVNGAAVSAETTATYTVPTVYCSGSYHNGEANLLLLGGYYNDGTKGVPCYWTVASGVVSRHDLQGKDGGANVWAVESSGGTVYAAGDAATVINPDNDISTNCLGPRRGVISRDVPL